MATESSLVKTKRSLRNVFLLFLLVIIANFTYTFLIDKIKEWQENITTPVSSIYLDTDEVFGELTLPQIDSSVFVSDESKPSFATLSEFGKFPEKVFVYKLIDKQRTFLTGQNATGIAANLKFNPESKQTGNLMSWSDDEGRELTFDSETHNWLLSPDINSVLSNSQPSAVDQSKVKTDLSKIITSIAVDKNFIDTNSPVFKKAEFRGGTLHLLPEQSTGGMEFAGYNYSLDYIAFKDATSSSSGDFLSENNLSKSTRIVTTDNLNFAMAFATQSERFEIGKLDYFKFTPIEIETTKGVYEIITANEAFQLLNQGQGKLVALYDVENLKSVNKVKIDEFAIDSSRSELVYFIQTDEIGYTYPVYVFYAIAKGNVNYEAIFYVDALKHL